MPVKLEYQYFQLERSGGDWDAVRAARNLAVYVPSDFPDPQLELVVLLPPK
jgi:predicted component of type VI protein secretion system